jgi:hypothetical protein
MGNDELKNKLKSIRRFERWDALLTKPYELKLAGFLTFVTITIKIP